MAEGMAMAGSWRWQAVAGAGLCLSCGVRQGVVRSGWAQSRVQAARHGPAGVFHQGALTWCSVLLLTLDCPRTVSNCCCQEHGSHCCYQPETRKQKIKAEVTKWCGQLVQCCARFVSPTENGKCSSDSHGSGGGGGARGGGSGSQWCWRKTSKKNMFCFK